MKKRIKRQMSINNIINILLFIMAKFFCEYCGVYLSQSSPKGRKQHLTGWKHVINKVEYYSKLLTEAEREKTF